MKLSNRIYSIAFLIFCSSFLFTGCSTKQTYDYSSYRKDTGDKSINNSEAMHRATMRPYNVFGIRYYPFVANVGDQFDGIASWYGPDFHAKKTSNGEIYNMYAMTAAHKTLPMNTVVRVDNLDNGRSTIVRINDRGPFVAGRIIDLSNKAAHEIDMVRKGTARVKVTVLGYNGLIDDKNAPNVNSIEQKPEVEKIEVIEDDVVATNINTNIGMVSAPITTSKSSSKESSKSSSGGKFSIQVGAFSLQAGALKTVDEYKAKFPSKKIEYVENGGIYRVYIRGFSSYDDGQNFKAKNSLTNAIVVQ
ncbi:septal ring lytic transglycosylase RlpA family protein [Aliarcobacter cryaerophilus]|uniref:Probable endolytic peptidoglycan transglycosylase RlpA n=4 Tax=Arcobacteraceae TaxID=2808963 RepID=A0AA96IKJ2_9BACT|nr:septal ring lytic transglycosylase RlpA family protein [Aliarcobacter cryaerophilus]OQA75795.1 MAG: RlpA-like protein precursor [Candidatus Dependentiae bacterium ADurb.Bin246]WNL30595.1 septal ring lytic transglycosylase RlpA family protein [Arcobacter sp. AZ-2023]WPD12332.1 septal ring lytic transglycosylase RlpA family protein [Arcobacter sp. DSM 115960]MCT7460976.1 septal ring lytic transglycosylase RlpA family protein [Aliarcobacter cryaerophilus]MCT7473151.1 septal ring lytic transgly